MIQSQLKGDSYGPDGATYSLLVRACITLSDITKMTELLANIDVSRVYTYVSEIVCSQTCSRPSAH